MDVEQIAVLCKGCGDMFRAFSGSVAAREELCTNCASHRDREPEENNGR